MTLAAFLAVAGLLTLGAVSPGPAVLMSARTGVSEGLRTGFFLSLGIGAGAEMQRPMAIAILGGLTTSTLLTLVVIPAIYVMVTRDGRVTR